VTLRFVLQPHPKFAAAAGGAVFKLPRDYVEIVVALLSLEHFLENFSDAGG